MQQLSGLDAAFLALETANSTGHVGGVSLLDARDLAEPLTLARLTRLVEERLPAAPLVLLHMPLDMDQPFWIDDPDFDIEYHIRELALPRPGSDAQLNYPVSVITDGLSLNITVVGYLGLLHFDLVGCRELVPDIDNIAGYLVDELEFLAKAAEEQTN